MLINLSEVFTLEGKEKTWEVPFEAKAYKGSRVEYPVVSAGMYSGRGLREWIFYRKS